MTESATNKETPPLWCVTIDTAARCLRISTRRVRQIIEEGHAIRHGANRVDLAWLIHLETGKGKWGRRPGRPDSLTLMALGWLVAHNFFRHEPEDVALLLGIATRNHYSEEAARVALGVAKALFPVNVPNSEDFE